MELKYKIQNWILSHLNFINSPDKNDVLKLVNEEHWKKTSCKNKIIDQL